MIVSVALQVALPADAHTAPVREVWKSFELPTVPRVGERILPLNGWGMATVVNVEWDLSLGEVTVIARYPSSSEEIEQLIAGGWSATVV